MSRATVWMSTEDVMDELRLPSLDAARKWIRRRKIARVRRGGPDGRTILVARADVERSFFERRRSHADEAQAAGAPVPTGGVGQLPAVRSSNEEESVV